MALRRLAAMERANPGSDGAQLASGLHDIVAPVLANLRDALGDDGCSALAERAFTRSEWEHPAATRLRGPGNCTVPRDQIVAAIDAYGPVATAEAVAAVVVRLLEILARIIGEDMAIGIMDHRLSGPAKDTGGQA